MNWSATASAAPDPDGFTAVSTAEAGRLPGRHVVDVIVAAERLIGHLQAAQLAAIAAFTRPGRAAPVDGMLDMLHDKIGPSGSRDPAVVTAHLDDLGRSLAASEIAAALHQSHAGASARVALAVELVHELPDTLAAVSDGRIDIARARTIADRTRLLPSADRHRVEADILPLARTRTPGQLNPMIDRRVIAIDPAAAHKRTITARRERSLDHRPAPDGMGDIHAHLPAEAAIDVYDLLDQLAVATAGQDNRTATARRADALTDLCTALLTDGHIDLTALLNPTDDGDTGAEPAEPAADSEPDGSWEPTRPTTAPDVAGTATPDRAQPPSQPRHSKMIGTRHGRPVHLNLTMTLAAFAGLSRDPAVLTGHGAITADLAAAIARSIATLSVHLTDADGHTTAVGGTTYVPSRAITDHVLAAAGTCRFPSCRMPAYRCDLDHRDPYDHAHPECGGRTCPENLDPLCRYHHRCKTHTGWRARRVAPDGLTMIWTSPTGHTYPQCPPVQPTTTGNWVPGSDVPSGTGHPRPDDFDHVDDAAPEPAGGEHTCHTCSACAATGRSINVRTQEIIERAAAVTVERQHSRRPASLLSPYASWSFRIGFNQPGVQDDTDDDEDAYDLQNDPGYQAPTDAFLQRFCPEHYQHVQQQRYAAGHPDADKPPF